MYAKVSVYMWIWIIFLYLIKPIKSVVTNVQLLLCICDTLQQNREWVTQAYFEI